MLLSGFVFADGKLLSRSRFVDRLRMEAGIDPCSHGQLRVARQMGTSAGGHSSGTGVRISNLILVCCGGQRLTFHVTGGANPPPLGKRLRQTKGS